MFLLWLLGKIPYYNNWVNEWRKIVIFQWGWMKRLWEKTDIYLWVLQKMKIYLSFPPKENFLYIPWSVICQNKRVEEKVIYVGVPPPSYIYNITKSWEWNQISKGRGDLSRAPENEEKGWFSNEDGWKDFGKKQTYIYGCFRKWKYICPFLLGKFPQYSMVCDLPK